MIFTFYCVLLQNQLPCQQAAPDCRADNIVKPSCALLTPEMVETFVICLFHLWPRNYQLKKN